MIRAVYFDLYNTLARFWPPREEIQSQVAREFDLEVTSQGILKGYGAADKFMSQENALLHLEKRSPEEQRDFFARYEQKIFAGAGVEVPLDVAASLWVRVQQIPSHLELFEDALPVIEQLKQRSLTLGLVTNIYQNLDRLCQRLGLASYLDFTVTSKEAGVEKPHPPIFLAALEKAGIPPSETVHVGDQYLSDVQGARGVGIWPVLIDRDDAFTQVQDCPKIANLTELPQLLDGGQIG